MLEKKIDKPSLYLNRYSITSYPNLNNKKKNKLITLDGVKAKLELDRKKLFFR